ncbi:MAG: maleylpyruvate isomerase family mycothiol-dependent enzyme [Acidimicrobiia bacterium]|nr:maleylpyruvate isomerase family mycothiol-dependent enzyme [Acidimicrobiia bacterium]
MTVTPQEHLDSIRRDGDAFAAAADGTLTEPITACPGWNQADLVYHLGEVHRFWTWIAEERADSPDAYEQPARPDDEDLLAWYRDGVDHLIEVLAAADPATPVWTWSSQQDVAFIQRRMAQETAVHRWDAQRAAGGAQPIAADLAAEGIDEFLDHFLDGPGEDTTGSVHLHAENGEWWLGPAGDHWDIEREHRKGDAALRGSASDLLLGLWRRVDVAALDVVGDEAVAARFLGHSNLE